jgi:hypothetical protein
MLQNMKKSWKTFLIIQKSCIFAANKSNLVAEAA